MCGSSGVACRAIQAWALVGKRCEAVSRRRLWDAESIPVHREQLSKTAIAGETADSVTLARAVETNPQLVARAVIAAAGGGSATPDRAVGLWRRSVRRTPIAAETSPQSVVKAATAAPDGGGSAATPVRLVWSLRREWIPDAAAIHAVAAISLRRVATAAAGAFGGAVEERARPILRQHLVEIRAPESAAMKAQGLLLPMIEVAEALAGASHRACRARRLFGSVNRLPHPGWKPRAPEGAEDVVKARRGVKAAGAAVSGEAEAAKHPVLSCADLSSQAPEPWIWLRGLFWVKG